MKNIQLTPKETLLKVVNVAHKYALVMFLVTMLAVYGFLLWRISYLSSLEPSEAEVTAQLKTAGVPKIDPEVVKKMQELKDNSVNVQTLFDQARDNPFQE